MVTDIATGTIMNGLVQYGVGQATLATPVFIDDANPPATLVYIAVTMRTQTAPDTSGL